MRAAFRVVFLVLAFLVFLSFDNLDTIRSTDYSPPTLTCHVDHSMQANYVPHAPVNIDSVDDFSASGFTGSGTLANPYMLEGVNITTNGDCIRIINVDAYFIIQNSLLTSQVEGSNIGIFLDHAPNGSIKSCTINSKNMGIMCSYSGECMIINNTIHHIHDDGVFLSSSNNCTLMNNSIWQINDEGIQLQGSHGCIFIDNIISANGANGIDLMGSNYCLLIENKIHENSRGVSLEGSNNCIVLNNTFWGNQDGILTDTSRNNTLTNNTVYDNEQNGIYLSGEIYCEIANNTIFDNPVGIKIIGSSDSILSNNTIKYNGHGVYLSECADFTFSSNRFEDDGVILDPSCDPNHFHHEFTNNIVNGKLLGYFWGEENITIDGVFYGQVILANCTNITIQYGDFHNTPRGVTLGHCTNCELINNTVYNCNYGGIFLTFSDNCTILNNSIFDNLEGGILLHEASNSTFLENSMEGNGFFIRGTSPENWQHNFTDNTVNGKPLGYFWNESYLVLTGSSYGQIILASCNNVTVKNGVFTNATMGIVMGFCADCKAMTNTLHDNAGVHVAYSDACVIYDNTIYENVKGVCIYDSQYCHAYNNTIFNNDVGITGEFWSYCTFSNNNITGNTDYGIDIDNSGNCSMINNIVSNNNQRGVYVSRSFNCTFSKNTIQNNSWEGVGLFWSDNCTVIGNTILDNSGNGVFVENSENYKISHNTIYTNQNGIELFDSPDFILSDNVIYDNNVGVWLVKSENGLLRNNTVYDNGWVGLYAQWSHNTTLINNTAYESNWAGIAIYESDNCTVVDCILFNFAHGALTIHSLCCNMTNNKMFNNAHGAALESSSKLCNLTNNDIHDNLEEGIVIRSSEDCFLISNKVYNNPGTGVWIDLDSANNTVYGNWIGWNLAGNAKDDGADNVWDNGISAGNAWGDYKGVGAYSIPGFAGAVDNYPSKGDAVSPTIDPQDDIEYEAGSTSNLITWSPYDDHPESYQVLRNHVEIESGSWNGSAIKVIIDGLSMNTYNYTLVVSDTCGNWARDDVIVIVVDTTPPEIDQPSDIQYNVGETGNEIIWNPFDYSPEYYEVSRNGTKIRSGSWNGSSIIVDIDALASGFYIFILYVEDLAGNSNSDTVFVTVRAITTTTTTTTSTTTDGMEDIGPLLTIVTAGGGIGAVILLAVFLFLRRRASLRQLAAPVTLAERAELGVQALRGCEIIGGQFHYKVKVKNDSEYVINKVTVSIISYPEDCLILTRDSTRKITMIEPRGFRSPEFAFAPTKDCVEGHIQATVSYIDHENVLRTLETEPYVIRSVCDLLKPLESTLEEFDLMLEKMTAASEKKTLEWNSEVLFSKIVALLPARNFQIIESTKETINGIFNGTVRGLAEGKYTGKKVALRIEISGNIDENRAKVAIEGLADDDAMLPITIHEITNSIISWTCLNCGAVLPLDDVSRLEDGTPIQCKYCGGTLSIDKYRKKEPSI